MADVDVTDAPGKAAKGVGGMLAKKMGPFPAGVWVVIVGAAGYVVYRTRSGKSATGTGVAGTGTGGGAGTADATGSGSYSPTGPSAGGNTTGSGNTGSSNSFVSNQAWATAAISYLTSLGYEGLLVNQGVQSFLASYDLSQSQQTLVNLAIVRLGPPPEAVPPSKTNPPPIVTPGLPLPVVGLQGTAVNANSVQLQWFPSDGAKVYKIRVTSKWGSSDFTSQGTSFKSVNTAANTTATWTVWASNDVGDSEARTVTVTTPPA